MSTQKRFREKILLNERGKPFAVKIDLERYRKLLERADDVADTAWIRTHRRDRFVSLKTVERELKKRGIL